MAMERQNAWGPLASLDMFLGGAGAGAFVVGFIVNLMGGMRSLALAGTLSGPLLVIAGTAMLLLEAGSPLKAIRLLTGLWAERRFPRLDRERSWASSARRIHCRSPSRAQA